MEGRIAELIASDVEFHQSIVEGIFEAPFHEIGHWRSFLRSTLNDNLGSMLRAPASQWSVRSFQAMFIACWVHHPVEKGTFMVNLGGLGQPQRDVIANAYKQHLYGRKSSHLSGSGRSASNGWGFLKGYHELLIQYEDTKGEPYLMLKAEGHTTGPSGVIPHLQSWVHKRKHGEGLMASPALNSLANTETYVEARAAENYAKHYKKLLKEVLGFSGKKVTVRDAMGELFRQANFNVYPPSITFSASNAELGLAIERYCDMAQYPAINNPHRINGQVTDEMLRDLREVAQTLKDDGNVFMPRVFREIRVRPSQVDQSLSHFYGYQP